RDGVGVRHGVDVALEPLGGVRDLIRLSFQAVEQLRLRGERPYEEGGEKHQTKARDSVFHMSALESVMGAVVAPMRLRRQRRYGCPRRSGIAMAARAPV